MATNKYLNLAGLSTVAENVNTRLKTVTSMPQDANIGAIRLYVGDDDENFKTGHTYKYVGGTQYWCYHDSDLGTWFNYTEGEPVVSGAVYLSGNVATSTENFEDETYTVRSITEEGLVVEGMKGVFPRYSEGDFTTFPWEDITPISPVQFAVMPTVGLDTYDWQNRIVQYVGETDENYTNGYFYKCVKTGEAIDPPPPEGDGLIHEIFGWKQINIQPTVQVEVMPNASSEYDQKIYQYIGGTDSSYTHGYFYICENDGGQWVWTQYNTQPGVPLQGYNYTQTSSDNGFDSTAFKTFISSIEDSAYILEYDCRSYNGEIYLFYGTLGRWFPPGDFGYPIWTLTNGVKTHVYKKKWDDSIDYEFIDLSGTDTYANDVIYDNTESGLSSNNVQGAIDEVVEGINEYIIPKLSVETLPTPTAELAGRVVQYVGNDTQDLTNGYFYECAVTGSQIETHDPQTIDVLKYDIEHYPTGTIQVDTGSGTEELDCLLNYYVYDDTIYRADNETGDISTDTALTTDEMVADEHLMYEVEAPTYDWVQKDVQPSVSSVISEDTFKSFINNPQLNFIELENDPTQSGEVGESYKLYKYEQNSQVATVDNYYTYSYNSWVLLGSYTIGREEILCTVDENFTAELYSTLISYNMPSDAENITYSNQDHPSLTDVGTALDDILAKLYYVNPAISTFTMTPSTTEYEIGASVSNLVFAWTYNKDIISQTLTDCSLTDETDRTATAAGPYTSDKTFTLTASDGENTVTSTKSISFKHKVYWGSAADGTIDSAFILALSGKKFATNYRGTYNMTVAQDEYGYLAYPSSWGTVTEWWINGFAVSVYDCGEVSFTNASGNTTTFRVIRTTQPSLGAISPEIK